jgi:hypothetical protein
MKRLDLLVTNTFRLLTLTTVSKRIRWMRRPMQTGKLGKKNGSVCLKLLA